jgi:hypothetical protein
VACAAYAVIWAKVNLEMEIQAVNKLAVVAGRVVAYVAVELVSNFVVIEDVTDNRRLGGSSMVSV